MAHAPGGQRQGLRGNGAGIAGAAAFAGATLGGGAAGVSGGGLGGVPAPRRVVA
jgi:hypothetical protein